MGMSDNTAKDEITTGVYPVAAGDITSLGGIPCRVEYVNYTRQRVSLSFAPGVRVHDYQEKGLRVKKFGPDHGNRSVKRARKSIAKKSEVNK